MDTNPNGDCIYQGTPSHRLMSRVCGRSQTGMPGSPEDYSGAVEQGWSYFHHKGAYGENKNPVD